MASIRKALADLREMRDHALVNVEQLSDAIHHLEDYLEHEEQA